MSEQDRGEPSVSIREYVKLDDGRTVPTKKGIFLTEDNYNALMQCEGVIKKLIEKTKKGETEQLKDQIYFLLFKTEDSQVY